MKSSCLLSENWFLEIPSILMTKILIFQQSIYPTPQIKIYDQAIMKGKKERKKEKKYNPPF